MPADLGQLQNFIKRDKDAYQEEFQLQHRHFLSELELFQANPASKSKHFTDLVGFLSQVAPCYPQKLAQFPQQLCNLLEQHGSVLLPETRYSVTKALILLRNRDLLSATVLLPLFFKVLRIPDKQLRKLLRTHIVADVRKMNAKKKNQAVNRTLQNFMSVMLNDASDIAARHSIDIMIELYRKKIWNDERTVNVVAQACLSTDTKIITSAVQFFLAVEEPPDEDDEDDAAQKTAELQKMMHNFSKNTRAKKNKIQKMKDKVHKQKRRDDYLNPNFPAIQLINDPQGFAEKLFGALKKSTEKFDLRIMIMNLISRLIAFHKLQLINFYPWMQRYLQPHQEHVTHILCILSQAVHDLVDSDSILPTVRVIANNFITDRASPAAMSVGLNTIRELCMRCPYAMDDTLLQDLVQYKKYKDKSVTLAARSLLSLFREIQPQLLAKKDRGKNHAEVQVRAFGELKAQSGVDGVELLDEYDLDGNRYSDNESDDDEDEDEDDSASVASGMSESVDYEDSNVDDDDEDNSDEDEEEGENKARTSSMGIFGMLLDDEDADDATAKEDNDNDDASSTRSTRSEGKSASSKSRKRVRPAPPTPGELRILTDEDFERIDALKMQIATERSSRKRSRTEYDETREITDEVEEATLLQFVKKRKNTYEDRMASVMEGREDREKFGSKKSWDETPSTNLKKKKNQPFMLQKQSRNVRQKAKRSASDKVKVRKKHVHNAISGDRRRHKK